MSATDLAPPTENVTLKRPMTKKRSSEILGDTWKFSREMLTFFRKTPKKVVQKFRQKFGPSVSEVLDPLVNAACKTIKSVIHRSRRKIWCCSLRTSKHNDVMTNVFFFFFYSWRQARMRWGKPFVFPQYRKCFLRFDSEIRRASF